MKNKIEFEELLGQKRWDLVQQFFVYLESHGEGYLIPDYANLMSDEDVQEYKMWDKETNGSTETQMDDNS